MHGKVQTVGVEETRRRLPEILRLANTEGAVTIVTKRGEPYAAFVLVHQALREVPNFSDLRGAAGGCFGDVAQFVGKLRDEWR